MHKSVTLPRGKAPVWGAGQIAVQIYRDIPSLLLLFYMTQLLSIPPAMAGAAIFIPKLFWSSVCDYTVGSLTDRYAGRFERRYLLLAAAVLLPITMIALFTPTDATESWQRTLHISLFFALYVTVFSMFSVPHLSIGAEITDVPREQSRVMAWRTVFLNTGVMLGAGIAPWLIQENGGDKDAYRLMAMTMAAICSAALVISFFGSRENHLHHTPSAKGTKWRSFREHRAFQFTLGAFFSQMIGQGAAYATLTYLVVFKLGVPSPFEALTVSVFLTCVAGILVQPLIVKGTNRFGSRRTFMVGCVLYASSLAWMALGPKGSLVSFYGGSIALGLTNSITWQSLYTRLSELIADDAARHNGVSHAGFFSSLFVASEKIAFALGGTLVAGTLLSLFAFKAGSDVQTEQAIWGIALIFSMVPMICNLTAIYLMSRSHLPVDQMIGEADRSVSVDAVA